VLRRQRAVAPVLACEPLLGHFLSVGHLHAIWWGTAVAARSRRGTAAPSHPRGAVVRRAGVPLLSVLAACVALAAGGECRRASAADRSGALSAAAVRSPQRTEDSERERRGCGGEPPQAESCGAAAVAEFARLYGVEMEPAAVGRIAGAREGQMMSLLEIVEELEQLGMHAKGFSAEWKDLVALDRPVIAHVLLQGSPHFVVIEKATDDWVRVAAGGEVWAVPARQFRESFGGRLLCLWLAGDRPEKPLRSSLAVEPELVVLTHGRSHPIDITLGAQGRPVTVKDVLLPAGWLADGFRTPLALPPGGVRAVRLIPGQSATEAGPLPADAAASRPGEALANVILLTDDPVHPIRYVTLVSSSSPPIAVHPTDLDFGDGTHDEFLTRRHRLWVQCAGTLDDLYVEPTEPWLRVDLMSWDVSERQLGEQWCRAELDVYLSLEALPQEGEVTAAVVMVCCDGRRSRSGFEVRVPARVRVLPETRAIPPQAFFGIVVGDGRITRRIQVVGPLGSQYRLGELAPRLAGLSASLAARGDGRSAGLDVTVDAEKLPIGESEGEIRVYVVQPQARPATITVPYYVCRGSS